MPCTTGSRWIWHDAGAVAPGIDWRVPVDLGVSRRLTSLMFLQLILVLVVLIPLLAILLDSQVGRALASRLERRGIEGPGDLTAERVAFLEGEVERLGEEISRLDEESQFLHKLLAERHEGDGAALPPGDEPS